MSARTTVRLMEIKTQVEFVAPLCRPGEARDSSQLPCKGGQADGDVATNM